MKKNVEVAMANYPPELCFEIIVSQAGVVLTKGEPMRKKPVAPQEFDVQPFEEHGVVQPILK